MRLPIAPAAPTFRVGMGRSGDRVCAAHCPHCARTFVVEVAALTFPFERPCPWCAGLVSTARPAVVPTDDERALLERLAARGACPGAALPSAA